MWTRTMIQRIASNPAYCGRYVAFRTKTTVAHERTEEGDMRLRNRTRLRATDDPDRAVLPAEVCPAIVSAEVWEQAQEQLMRNKEEAARNNKYPRETLLRGGYAICGYCGARMTSSSIGPREKKMHQYRCQTRGYTICPCPGGSFGILASVLDKAIWCAIQYLFSDPARVRTILELQLNDQSEKDAREEERRLALDGQLERIERQLENATKSALDAPDEQTRAVWSNQVNQLVPQQIALQKDLVDLERARASRGAAVTYLRTIEDWCVALGPAIAEATYEEKRYLIRGLKTKVTCFRRTHDPYYIVEWDLAGLHETLRHLLPRLTDRDIASFCDSGLFSSRRDRAAGQ
jgi:hypothetical protein